jgi:hypothetical protein
LFVPKVLKYNKGHYEKRHLWIKDDNIKYKREVEQWYGKLPKKKNQTEILEIKSPFNQTKNSGRPHQQTGKSGRQNLRAQR